MEGGLLVVTFISIMKGIRDGTVGTGDGSTPPPPTPNLNRQIATKFGEDGVEYIGALPDNWEVLHLPKPAGEVAILSEDVMKEN